MICEIQQINITDFRFFYTVAQIVTLLLSTYSIIEMRGRRLGSIFHNSLEMYQQSIKGCKTRNINIKFGRV